MKILLIEDEPTQILTIKTILEQSGFEAEVAVDGESGIKKVGEWKPDLILLDIVMPKVDGITVLKTIKKNLETKNIPVIILTNLTSSDTIKEALDLGALDYLVKTDFTLMELIEKVKRYVNR